MKAYNIQRKGGKGMLLIYDSNQIDDDNIYNIDDIIGKKVTIPSMIIPKDFGNIIKKYIEENKNETIIISMKFPSALNNGKIKLELFYNTDDYKIYNFFKEFEYYKNKLSNVLIFTPRLKYYVIKGEKTSNELNSNSKIPCIKQKPFCVNSINKLKLDNPREILLENLRQSCIFEVYDLNKFWSYMINFSNKCSNYEKLNFNEECSKKIINELNLNYKEIEKCMENLINSEGKIEDDYNEYNKRKIISIPQLTINNIYYRDIWSAKKIFNKICNGFLNNKKICSSLSPEDVKYHFNFGINMIILITFGIALLLFCIILCFRRMVNRAFEDSLDDKIKEQALVSIRQYENFRIRNSSHKLELINE